VSKIKAIQRIPTEQYAYLEIEQEFDSIEDAVEEHCRLSYLYNKHKKQNVGDGLSIKDFAKVRRDFILSDGKSDDLTLSKMDREQRQWIKWTLSTLRDLKNKLNEE
jgi:hypothetical protein